jgi:hypothetical protein
LFVPLKDDVEFLAYLRTTQPPFLDPMNRWAFALALADTVGDHDALMQAVKELEGIAQSRTLPIKHKLLLQSVGLQR